MWLGELRAPLIVGALIAGLMSPMRPASAECAFCELAAMQNASYAIGHRFLTLMPRQAEIARRGIRGGGFIPLPDTPSSAERDNWVGALLDGTREPGSGGWAMWVAGFAGAGSRGDSTVVGSVNHRVDAAGVASGIDYRVSRTLLLGAAVAVGTGGYSVDTRESSGNAQSILLGVYGSWSRDTLYADMALYYGFADHVVARRIRSEEVDERASGAFSGHQFGGRIEVGWRTLQIPADITPFAALTVQRLHQDGHIESARAVSDGSVGNFGMTFSASSAWSVRSELGVQLMPNFVVDALAPFTPRFRVAWAHEFATTRNVAARLTGSPGNPFVTQGIDAARDALVVSAGLQLLLRSAASPSSTASGLAAATSTPRAAGSG